MTAIPVGPGPAIAAAGADREDADGSVDRVPGLDQARGDRREECDRGGVTIELAIGLATLMTVLVMALGAILALVNQVRVVDAAAEAARLAARGDQAQAWTAIERLAPSGAAADISVGPEWTTVSIRAPAISLLPGLHVSATAVAATEERSDGP